jgi:hypothetical protein
MADTGPIPLPGPRPEPGWPGLRQAIACLVREHGLPGAEAALLERQVAYAEDLAEQRAARAYDQGFTDGAARRRPRRPGMPRPRWLRAAD